MTAIITTKSRQKYSRRAFLAGLGLGPGLLPVISTDRLFAGCLAAPPKRLLAVVWTNGVLEWPGTGTDFTLPNTMKALNDVKSDIIPIRGLRLQNLKDTPNPQKADNVGHGATPALLTGKQYAELRPFVERGGGPSIDAFVATELQKKGVQTPRLTLNLSAAWEGYVATWKEAGKQASPDNDPNRVFTDIFAGKQGTTDPNFAKLQMAKKSMLDQVKRDLEVFKGRVGTENADRIDAHLTSVRELEKNLQAAAMGPGASGCMPPTIAKTGTGAGDFDKVIKNHIDIAVAALAADVTRAITIQLGNEGNQHVLATWLGFNRTGDESSGVGDSSSLHSIAHRGGNDKLKLDTWYHEQFASLLKKMKAEKEGDGSSLLDNSTVVFANHMQNGGSHSIDNVGFLLAGRCGGYFKTGQSISQNVPHTAVLKEMIKAMGVDPTAFFQPQYAVDLPAVRMA